MPIFGIQILGGVINLRGGSVLANGGLTADGAFGILPAGGQVNVYRAVIDSKSDVGINADIAHGPGKVTLYDSDAIVSGSQTNVTVINAPLVFSQSNPPVVLAPDQDFNNSGQIDDYPIGPVELAADQDFVNIGQSANVTVTPIVANTGNPLFAVRDLAPLAQGSAPVVQWTIVDGQRPVPQPVNLTGKTVRFVAYKESGVRGRESDPCDATLTPLFEYQTGGGGIVVSGTNNNLVTLTMDPTHTATAGPFGYWLLNVTDRLPLAQGKMPIVPAVWSA